MEAKEEEQEGEEEEDGEEEEAGGDEAPQRSNSRTSASDGDDEAEEEEEEEAEPAVPVIPASAKKSSERPKTAALPKPRLPQKRAREPSPSPRPLEHATPFPPRSPLVASPSVTEVHDGGVSVKETAKKKPGSSALTRVTATSRAKKEAAAGDGDGDEEEEEEEEEEDDAESGGRSRAVSHSVPLRPRAAAPTSAPASSTAAKGKVTKSSTKKSAAAVSSSSPTSSSADTASSTKQKKPKQGFAERELAQLMQAAELREEGMGRGSRTRGKRVDYNVDNQFKKLDKALGPPPAPPSSTHRTAHRPTASAHLTHGLMLSVPVL